MSDNVYIRHCGYFIGHELHDYETLSGDVILCLGFDSNE